MAYAPSCVDWRAEHRPAPTEPAAIDSAAPHANPLTSAGTKTTAAFKEFLRKLWWKEIEQDLIRNLFHSMPARARAVIAEKGHMTRY